jgi:hypothetical protein
MSQMNRKTKLEKYRFLVPLYGDIPLVIGLFNGQFWTNLFRLFKEPNATFYTLGKFIGFFVNIYAFSVRVFVRYRHGRLTIGWILAFFTVLTMLLYNWQGRKFIWTPLYAIWFPIKETLFREPNPWFPDIIYRYHSEYVWWMCAAFCVLAIVHIIISYLPFGGKEENVKRGIPVLWAISALFFKGLRGKKNWMIWWVLETSIIIGLALYIGYYHDSILARYLIIAATCHGLLEAYEFFGLRSYISR